MGPPDAQSEDGGGGGGGEVGDASADVGPGGGKGDAGEAPPPDPWFSARTPVELSLRGPFGDAFRAAYAGLPDGIFPPVRTKDPFAASLVIAARDGGTSAREVSLAVRGNSSLQECGFPKLKLTLGERETDPAALLFGTKKVKLGSHCGEDEAVDGVIGRLRHEKATYREEAVYQLAHALGIVTLATRPALITYTDTESEPAFPSPITRKALLLEHIDELARRLGAEALVDPADCGPDPNARPDPADVLRVRFFHALVGNWDFTLGPPESGGCGPLMNTEVLVHADGHLTLVPADFDLAALVVGEVRNPDTNQLEPISAEGARRAVQRDIATYTAGEDAAALSAMRAEYRGQRSALEAVLDASPMDAEGKQGARLLLDAFFAEIEAAR
jgi:hypothetical protein